MKSGGHYSTYKKVDQMVYTAGLTPRDESRNVVGQTIREQTTKVIDNLKSVLNEAGCGLEDLIKVNVYLAHMDQFEQFDQTYKEAFGGAKPVRTTIGCQLRGVLVEIDAVARIPEESR